MHRILLTLTLLCAATSFGGVKVVWDRVGTDGKPAQITMQCEGENARFEGIGGDRPTVAIWDAKKQALEVIRDDDKSYMLLEPAQVAAMRERAVAMAANLDKMTPEKREQLEKMLGGHLPEDPKAEWVFTPSGKKTKVGKWDCEPYTVKRGSSSLEMCVIPWDKSPLKREDLKCVKPISDMFKGMASAEADGMTDLFDKFPGMPAQSVRDAGEGKKATTTLKSAEHVTVPPSAFEVPEGYKQTAMKRPPPPPPAKLE